MQGIAQLGGLVGGYLLAAGILKLFISTYWTICILFDISLVYIWFRFFYSGDRRIEAAAGMNDFESFVPADGRPEVSDVVSFDLNSNNNNDDNNYNDHNDDDDVGDNYIDQEVGDFSRRNRNGSDRLDEVGVDGLGQFEHEFDGDNYDNIERSTSGSARGLVLSGGGGGGGGGGEGSSASSSWSSFIGRRLILYHF